MVWPIIAAASTAWKSIAGDKKTAENLKTAFSSVFGAEENLHIALDDFAEPLGEAMPGPSGPARRGGEGDDAWVEWDFDPPRKTVPYARLDRARWRFYASGLIVFNGVFATERAGVDGGDLLGHRVELATEDGLVLGAWLAGFFVRPDSALDRYVSTARIEHAALKRHFGDLAEAQNGCWFRRR